MVESSDVFEKNYQEYDSRLANVNFDAVKDTLGLIVESGKLFIPFFNQRYQVSASGIFDEQGNRPDYIAFIILAQYILLCPDQPHYDPQWAAFKDFKRASHFTNVNYFASDTEQAIEKNFSGKKEALAAAGKQLGGVPEEVTASYDLSMRFAALPRISLLMLFNDQDDEFPAKCSVLFQKHAEFYLDPESLAMTGAYLAQRLTVL